MKRMIAAAMALTLSACAPNLHLHVSPDGDDAAAGTRDAPLKTLARARDVMRERKAGAADPGTVILQAGRYPLSETFELDERDSNTRYVAADGQDVRLTGGLEVPIASLQPVTDENILGLLPAQVRAKVVKLALPDGEPGGVPAWPDRFRGYAGWPQIHIDGQALRLARWPNTGYAKIAKVLDRGSRPRHGEKPDRGGRFAFSEKNPGNWRTDRPIYLGGYWCFKWYDEFIRVESIDAAEQHVQMAAPHQYGLGGPSGGLYFAINLLEELDQPGEYVYDGRDHVLYILLPVDAKGALQVSTLREPLVRIDKAENLSFQGITFENGCHQGVEITESRSVVLSDCTIRHVSGSGVRIVGGKACGVDRSRLHDIGKTAVRLDGGNREQLVQAGHFVTDCEISHFARTGQTYCPAVSVKGVGQVVSNNHLHDAPHCAILLGGNDHQLTFNHIERVCLDTSDAGAIYCGRDWTLGGNRIHGNFIHDLGSAVHHRNWAIYLDDMASGIAVTSNVVINTDAGFLIGGGRSNVIAGNVIRNCPQRSIVIDARATGWAGKHTRQPDGTLWKRLNAMPFGSGVWLDRFPYLAQIEGDAYNEPRHNTVKQNRLFGTPAMQLAELAVEHGTVVQNTHSDALPEIRLEDGTLTVSEADLAAYGSMTIGPRADRRTTHGRPEAGR